MDMEQELNAWMEEHQTELFDIIRQAMEDFSAAHPGTDQAMIRMNALSMADRRFMARAISQVLSKYLPQQPH